MNQLLGVVKKFIWLIRQNFQVSKSFFLLHTKKKKGRHNTADPSPLTAVAGRESIISNSCNFVNKRVTKGARFFHPFNATDVYICPKKRDSATMDVYILTKAYFCLTRSFVNVYCSH